MHPEPSPRRGWRQTVEPGIYRVHRVACPRTADRRPGGRCACPYALKVPGSAPGATRTVTHPGPIAVARAERRRLMAEGRPGPAVREPETLTEFFAAWMRANEHRVAPATLYYREEAFRLRIGPALGRRFLTEISPEAVAGFVNELADAATPARAASKAIEVLSACLATAARWGRIASNPCAGIPAGRIRVGEHREEAERRVLAPGELLRLFGAATSPRNLTLIRVASEAGLRRGELIGLRWPDVDLTGFRLHVRRSVWQERDTGVKITKSPKGHTARTIPIGADLTTRLGDWYAISVIEGGADAGGPLWPGRGGGVMAADTPSQVVERACRRVGLVDVRGRPLVTLHGLRHGCGSLMLMAGVPLIAVSRFLGHANVQITATVYSHLVDGEDQLRAASEALGGLLATHTVRETVRERDDDREIGVE